MNRVLETTKYVVENAESVSINLDKVKELAHQFRPPQIIHWLNIGPTDITHLSDEEKLSFMFIFDTLSFSYWGEPKWTVEYRGKKYDGSWGLVASIARATEEGRPILDSAYRTQLSKEEFADILRGNVSIPLLDERHLFLREAAQILEKKFSGSVVNLVKTGNGSAENFLNTLLENFPLFRDQATYSGKNVFFWKRAQMFVGNTYQLFGGKGLGKFSDIHFLTAAADYKLPQLLREAGILEYQLTLADKVDTSTEIPHGSPEEVEIRASTVWAIQYLK